MKTEWDLKKHFFTGLDDPNIDICINNSVENVNVFIEKFKGKISKFDVNGFLEYLEYKSPYEGLVKVNYYYNYLSTLNTQDQLVLKKSSELSNIWSDISKDLLFISEEYKVIGYDKLIEFSENVKLSKYKNYFINTANSLKYRLSEDQERVLIEPYNVLSIFNDIYDELTNSFLYPFEGSLITRSDLSNKRESQIESERKEATDSILNKFSEKSNQIVLGNIYKSVCKDNITEIKNRGYEDVMSTRNISEEMESDVVNKLLEKVKSNYSLYHKHLKNKAKLLGKDVLDYWDIFAPIPNTNETKMSFEDGYNFYLNNIRVFDEEFYNYSKEMFEDGRVSVFPYPGKQDGAYASYNKDHKSFVMLNHTEDLNSVMTLAHESGHAIHGWYSQEQPDEVYGSPLSLAETASIFNETLIFENLLKGVSDNEREYYIISHLDDIFSTMFRQVMYVNFEKECHNRFLSGEELSYTDFNEIWLRNTKELYGDSVVMDDKMGVGWSSIPHIFGSPFYCYSYSFGNILSFNLYQMYKESDDKDVFKTMYKSILKSGGSVRPKELLLNNGIDITSDEFYDKAFDVIKGFLN